MKVGKQMRLKSRQPTQFTQKIVREAVLLRPLKRLPSLAPKTAQKPG
jgi:hypothetical protein